ncbi:MAG: flagellar hook assembly protein FlgD [Methylobacter tundripaludum]|uniref:Basal-body rod modification protein FlgD n=1 Tax=Methylobacter tundripaludum TaxID=173365 RepID=A0A2S6H2W8_9GAMM|nr:flagellar hook assembly protein FlgD [Methylobacter tundripaludum]MCK9637466.1 flagellar hook assembly protein FlgD [Methylobacter tundripaludum]PPK71835.1 flagellar basal-body rod modification protein FlgD [Methylobacter tundripaludum]
MAIQGTTTDYSSLTVTPKKDSEATRKASLGQEQFLKLMTAQMTHQDPSSPMQNGEFITQMAQFGTVSGIQDLQKSFADFASSINSSQALQATSLVGRYVSVPGTKAVLPAGGEIKGAINLADSSSSVKVKVTNANTGEIVQNIDLGQHSAGKVPFVWDGVNSNGAMANPGVYKIEATAYIDGKNTVLETDLNAQVDSVTMGNGSTGMKVNLTGLDSVDFNKIKQIL